ncbi:hypothetical protein AMAG_20132 [Allomyces macrogynus ATCC 38327]|uniref:Uncharacterized protein n=1 Tax=Allomyces macrogynus (strain ATCC 38327) TaxID=578462 RepID=A0A0L0T5A2_ALLM3|nr:hypothetical protein AMAG_20132 [Allomyces macrogynus ATCC 38327]|eukprot:KNE69891.1 hypothetical protein AMAG_20132 [Allomyces macrogynus ATCC 38327]
MPSRRSALVRSKAYNPAPCWTLLLVQARQLHFYQIAGKIKDETVDCPPIPSNCRFLTIGLAKGTMSYMPPISSTVETLALEHLRLHYDNVFATAFFDGMLPPALRSLRIAGSGSETNDALLTEVIPDH